VVCRTADPGEAARVALFAPLPQRLCDPVAAVMPPTLRARVGVSDAGAPRYPDLGRNWGRRRIWTALQPGQPERWPTIVPRCVRPDARRGQGPCERRPCERRPCRWRPYRWRPCDWRAAKAPTPLVGRQRPRKGLNQSFTRTQKAPWRTARANPRSGGVPAYPGTPRPLCPQPG
jgi:hypothetical protein